MGLERPALEERKAVLIRQQNTFTARLAELEEVLLYQLSSAKGDILSDLDLIEGLESTKR